MARRRAEMEEANEAAERADGEWRAALGAILAAAEAGRRREAEDERLTRVERRLEPGAPERRQSLGPGEDEHDTDEPEPGSLEWKERFLEPQIPPPPPPFDLAKWKQEDYAAVESAQRAEALQRYWASGRASVPAPSATATPSPRTTPVTTPQPVPTAPPSATATPQAPRREVSRVFPPPGYPDPRDVPELAFALRSG